MKDFLQDLVAHTHSLGVLPDIRVKVTDDNALIDALSDDRRVILQAATHSAIPELTGNFGMTNLHKLDLHLKCPEYRDNAIITLTVEPRGGDNIPTGIHFQNESGDYQNDFRFMNINLLDLSMKSSSVNISNWDIEFQPTQANIQRFKYQVSAHTEETLFQVSTKDNNLIFSFGDLNTHAGSFVFQTNVTGTIKGEWLWPKSTILNVLNLDGDKFVKITDKGAFQITVDSGITLYNYIFKAHVK